MRHRLALLLLLALVGARAAAQDDLAWGPPRIRGEVAALASAVEADAGASVSFVSTWSSLNVIRGHAWILSLWVEDAPVYGAQYFVLSEVDGRLVGEALEAPGPGGTRTIVGDELARYLARVELEAAPIRAAFERHHRLHPR